MYAGRELISILEGMVAFTQFVSDPRVIQMNKLKGITEMIFNLDELDNTNNLEDGKPSNALLTYHVTADEDFTCFDPHITQHKKLRNGEFVSLTLRIMDQKNNIITDDLQVTVIYETVNHNFFSHTSKMEYGNKLNQEHSLQTSYGIKGTRQKVIVTHNPSEID